MGRSFEIAEDKVHEAEFFLEKLRFEDSDPARFDIQEAAFYLSAFLSAARSITFCLRASLNDHPSFDAWYSSQQAQLKDSELARFFLEARNLSQKVGYYPLSCARIHMADPSPQVELYFAPLPDEPLAFVPTTDVATACESQLRQLLAILVECYRTFGSVIDPEKYYTVENMTALGLRVEDFEQEVDLTQANIDPSTLTVEERVGLVRLLAPKVRIDWIFQKYLGTDRYGDPVPPADPDSEDPDSGDA